MTARSNPQRVLAHVRDVREPLNLSSSWVNQFTGKLYEKLLKMAIAIVDLPIKNGDFP
jgi:hypothetical protein